MPSTNITALAVRLLNAVLAEDLSPIDAYVRPWLQPVLGNPFFSVCELPTRCNMDVVVRQH